MGGRGDGPSDVRAPGPCVPATLCRSGSGGRWAGRSPPPARGAVGGARPSGRPVRRRCPAGTAGARRRPPAGADPAPAGRAAPPAPFRGPQPEGTSRHRRPDGADVRCSVGTTPRRTVRPARTTDGGLPSGAVTASGGYPCPFLRVGPSSAPRRVLQRVGGECATRSDEEHSLLPSSCTVRPSGTTARTGSGSGRSRRSRSGGRRRCRGSTRTRNRRARGRTGSGRRRSGGPRGDTRSGRRGRRRSPDRRRTPPHDPAHRPDRRHPAHRVRRGRHRPGHAPARRTPDRAPRDHRGRDRPRRRRNGPDRPPGRRTRSPRPARSRWLRRPGR